MMTIIKIIFKIKKAKNILKRIIFFFPMHLLIRIECLKKPSTQIPQMKQCLTLFDFLILYLLKI